MTSPQCVDLPEVTERGDEEPLLAVVSLDRSHSMFRDNLFKRAVQSLQNLQDVLGDRVKWDVRAFPQENAPPDGSLEPFAEMLGVTTAAFEQADGRYTVFPSAPIEFASAGTVRVCKPKCGSPIELEGAFLKWREPRAVNIVITDSVPAYGTAATSDLQQRLQARGEFVECIIIGPRANADGKGMRSQLCQKTTVKDLTAKIKAIVTARLTERKEAIRELHALADAIERRRHAHTLSDDDRAVVDRALPHLTKESSEAWSSIRSDRRESLAWKRFKRSLGLGAVEREAVVAILGPRTQCSGVVVGRRAVLTARHCVPAREVRGGANVAEPSFVQSIQEVHLHPDPAIDLAIVETQAELSIGSMGWVREPQEAPIARLSIGGYGSDGRDHMPTFGLRHTVDIPQLEGWGCTPARQRLIGCDPETEMVLVDPGGRDTCDGDSGGPVFEARRDQDRCWRVIAITSRAADVRRTSCGEGGIYTRLDVQAEWVEAVVTAIETEDE